jgi:hypothetical protein
LGNKRVAAGLGMVEGTIAVRLRIALRKLGCRDRVLGKARKIDAVEMRHSTAGGRETRGPKRRASARAD